MLLYPAFSVPCVVTRSRKKNTGVTVHPTWCPVHITYDVGAVANTAKCTDYKPHVTLHYNATEDKVR